MDTEGSCDLCMYTGFKELDELAQETRLHGLEEDETDPRYTVLDAILWSASGQTSEEDLSWALVDKTA